MCSYIRYRSEELDKSRKRQLGLCFIEADRDVGERLCICIAKRKEARPKANNFRLCHLGCSIGPASGTIRVMNNTSIVTALTGKLRSVLCKQYQHVLCMSQDLLLGSPVS